MEARNSRLPNVFKDVWLSTEEETAEEQDKDPNIMTFPCVPARREKRPVSIVNSSSKKK